MQVKSAEGPTAIEVKGRKTLFYAAILLKLSLKLFLITQIIIKNIYHKKIFIKYRLF